MSSPELKFPKRIVHPWMVLTVLFWGVNFAAVKYLYSYLSPQALTIARFIPMYIVVVLMCVQMKLSLKYPRCWRESGLLLLQGCLSMGVYMILFLDGMQRISPGEGAILLATSPLWTSFIAMLVRMEKFQGKFVIGAAISLVGVALVESTALGGEKQDITGALMILAGALCWASSTVMSRPLLAKYHPMQILALGLPGALPVLLPYGWHDFAHVNWAAWTPGAWGCFLHVSILAGAVGFYGFYQAVRDVGPTFTMLHQFLVPPVALVTGVVLLHEPVVPLQLAGMVVVLAGVAFARLPGKKRPEPTEVT